AAAGRPDIGHAELQHAWGKRNPPLCHPDIPKFLQRKQHPACRGASKPACRSHLAERHGWPVGFERPDDIQAACQRLDEVGSCFTTHHFPLRKSAPFLPGTLCYTVLFSLPSW